MGNITKADSKQIPNWYHSRPYLYRAENAVELCKNKECIIRVYNPGTEFEEVDFKIREYTDVEFFPIIVFMCSFCYDTFEHIMDGRGYGFQHKLEDALKNRLLSPLE